MRSQAIHIALWVNGTSLDLNMVDIGERNNQPDIHVVEKATIEFALVTPGAHLEHHKFCDQQCEQLLRINVTVSVTTTS